MLAESSNGPLRSVERPATAQPRSPFLLTGKKGLIASLADERSIAWGAARACRALGADLALTYRSPKVLPRVEPLARAVQADLLLPLDLRHEGELEAVFEAIAARWGRLDFLVHSLAFAGALKSRVVDVPKAAFLEAMEISCWSFVRMTHLAQSLMADGGCLITYSYLGAQLAVPGYNVMGPVKAALESAVRQLAAELGPRGIRVHALSLGPLATRAASGIAGLDGLLARAAVKAPLRRPINIDDVGRSTAFLVSDAARHLTGSLHFVDGGYHIVA
jgi:enoyl-[acyl-carrier protein] reductase I